MIAILLVAAGLMLIVGSKDFAAKTLTVIAGLVLIVTFAPMAAHCFSISSSASIVLLVLGVLLGIAVVILIVARLAAQQPSPRPRPSTPMRHRAQLVEPIPPPELNAAQPSNRNGDDLNLLGGDGHGQGG